MPKVSVIIRAKNEARYLGETLEAIHLSCLLRFVSGDSGALGYGGVRNCIREARWRSTHVG